jgi:hypothetical protein
VVREGTYDEGEEAEMKICDECMVERIRKNDLPSHGEVFGVNKTRWTRTRCEQCGTVTDCVNRTDIEPLIIVKKDMSLRETILARLDQYEREVYEAMRPQSGDTAGDAVQRVWNKQGRHLYSSVRTEQLMRMILKLVGE